MSILKKFLAEDLKSMLRKPAAKSPEERGVQPGGITTRNQLIASSRRITTPRPGVKVVILNWMHGDNDPFTVVNETIRQHLRACGKNAEVVEISEEDWPRRLTQLDSGSVEFVFTWQGFCSDATVGDDRVSLWDHLKIPLICVHGDHPSQMPTNHELESRYCFHLYTNAEFARYSNRHFRKIRSASVIDIPQLHREPRLKQRFGEHFVFAKNINDPNDTERKWRDALDKSEVDLYMAAAESLKSRIAREPYVEMHDVLDELLAERRVDWINPAVNAPAYHQYHRELDHYLRSHKSIFIVNALREFPLHIYGRGWDRIAANRVAHHVFHPGRNMADSQQLYYTRFGLVDVSPSKGLHDRTRRAMVNGTGFLSSANLEDSFVDIDRFDPLFFNFMPSELPEKCAAVVHDPDAHEALARQFADRYHDRFHFRSFMNRIEALANLARAG